MQLNFHEFTGWHFAAMGSLVGVAVAIRHLILGRTSERWPVANGRITESRMKGSKTAEGEMEWQPVVRYEYAVSGRTYTGNRIGYHLQGGTRASSTAITVSQYPVGSSVVVHYNPASPAKSVLEPGLSPLNWLFLCISVFLASAFIWVAASR